MDPRRWGQGLEVSQTTLWENLQEVQNPPWPPPPTHSHPNPRPGALGFSPPLPVVPTGKTLSPRAAARPIGWTPAGIKGHGAEPSGAGILLFFSLCASRTAGHLLKASIWPDLKIWLWIRREVQIKLPSLCATHYLCINPIFFSLLCLTVANFSVRKKYHHKCRQGVLKFCWKKGKLYRLKGRKFVSNPGESTERPQGSAVLRSNDVGFSCKQKVLCAKELLFFSTQCRPKWSGLPRLIWGIKKWQDEMRRKSYSLISTN